MSPQKIMTKISVFNDFLGKIMPLICLAALAAVVNMYIAYLDMPKIYFTTKAADTLIAESIARDTSLRFALTDMASASIARDNILELNQAAMKQEQALDRRDLDYLKKGVDEIRRFLIPRNRKNDK